MNLVTLGFGVINNMLVMGLTNVNVKVHYEGEKTVPLPLPEEFGEAYKQVVGERQLSHHYPAWRSCDLIGHESDTLRWITPQEYVYAEQEYFIHPSYNNYVRQMLYEITATYITEAFKHLENNEVDKAFTKINECIEVMNIVLDYFKIPVYTILNDIKLYPNEIKYSYCLTIYTRE